MSEDISCERRKIDKYDHKKSISRHVKADGSVWEKNFQTGEWYQVLAGDGSYKAPSSQEKEAAEKRRLAEQRQAIPTTTQEFQKYQRADETKKLNHPYCVRKQIKNVKNIGLDNSGNPIIPMIDENGEIWNYQKIITSEKKYFKTGARVKGLYFDFTESGEEVSDRIFICEGFATGDALKQVLAGDRIICAMTANNLEGVAEIIKKKYPGANIIIAGDNDKAGKYFGDSAAFKVGGVAIYPQEKKFDWNDVLIERGAANTLEEINCAIAESEEYDVDEESAESEAIPEDEDGDIERFEFVDFVDRRDDDNNTVAKIRVVSKHTTVEARVSCMESKVSFSRGIGGAGLKHICVARKKKLWGEIEAAIKAKTIKTKTAYDSGGFKLIPKTGNFAGFLHTKGSIKTNCEANNIEHANDRPKDGEIASRDDLGSMEKEEMKSAISKLPELGKITIGHALSGALVNLEKLWDHGYYQELPGLVFFGPTSLGKTKYARLASSVWAFNLTDFNSTSSFAETQLAGQNGQCVVFDEIGNGDQKRMRSRLYGAISGRGRGRCFPDGAPRPRAEWSCSILFTSEDPLDDILNEAGERYTEGLNARFLNVDFNKIKDYEGWNWVNSNEMTTEKTADDIIRDKLDVFLANSGAIGRAFVTELFKKFKKPEEVRLNMERKMEFAKKEIRKTFIIRPGFSKGIQERKLRIACLILCGLLYAKEFGMCDIDHEKTAKVLGDILNMDVNKLIATQLGMGDKLQASLACLQLARIRHNGNRDSYKYVDETERKAVSGFWDCDGSDTFWLTKAIRDACKANGWSFLELKKKGFLEERRITINGQKMRFTVINQEKMAEEEEAERQLNESEARIDRKYTVKPKEPDLSTPTKEPESCVIDPYKHVDMEKSPAGTPKVFSE